MESSSIPLPQIEVIAYSVTERNQRLFMKVIKWRWWSDEEENARQKQGLGQRSLSRIKRSVCRLLDVLYESDKKMYRDEEDVLRAQGMSIEYLPPYESYGDLARDKDDFLTSCCLPL